MRQRLIPERIIRRLPLLEVFQDAIEPVAYIRLILPGMPEFSLYLLGYDQLDACLGLVIETGLDLNHFSLSALQRIKGPDGQRIQLDRRFKARPLSDILRQFESPYGEGNGICCPCCGNQNATPVVK